MALDLVILFPPEAFTNRCDSIGKIYSTDIEGGRNETEVLEKSDLACSVQPASPQVLDSLGMIGTSATDLVFFPFDPGLGTNEEIEQIDISPRKRMTVVRTQDLGGLGVLWCSACKFVG
jgi:hypothetical protein